MSEELQEALEEISMLIIANSGAARSAAFEALQAAKKKDFIQTHQLMESAENGKESVIDMCWGHVNRNSDEEDGKVCRGQRHRSQD